MTELKPVFTVSELNEYVDLMLSRDPFMGELTVTGEISAFKRHTSGHLYFTLKDDPSASRDGRACMGGTAPSRSMPSAWRRPGTGRCIKSLSPCGRS